MVSAVILAAGASTRMGFPKALASIGGTALLELHLQRLAGLVAEIVVVLGCNGDRIRAGCDLRGAIVVDNPAWASGPESSLGCGLAGASPGASILLTPVDCPPVGETCLNLLLGARGPGVAALIPTCTGRPGHPVWLSAQTRQDLLQTSPPTRLDLFLEKLGPALRRVETGEPGILLNINNINDLQSYTTQLPPRRDRG